MRLSRFSLALAILICLLFTSAAAAQIRDQQSTSDQPLIIYSSRGELHTMEINGSNNTILGFTGYSPVWSPDGSRIAVSASMPQLVGYTIVVYDREGSILAQLTNRGNAFTPFWSPSGERIAFSALMPEDSLAQIYVANSDGGSLERLTTTGGSNPAWSPDGEQIAYSSFADGTLEIWVMDADGSSAHRITSKGGDAPEFSPDGSLIAFVMPTGERPTMASDPDTPTALFIMRIDGANIQQLTPDGMDVFNPSWSPDGTRIIFQADTPEEPDREIYTIDFETREPVQLTFNEIEDYSPDWYSP